MPSEIFPKTRSDSLTAPKLDSLQALRGVAALIVVLFHASGLSNDYIGGVLYNPGMLIGIAGVDLFFVISGFVMVYTTYEKFDLSGTPTHFAIARLSRIYPSYWVLTFLVFLYWLYNPSGVNAKHGGADPVASFLLLPGPLLPLVPVAWTLVHEVFFYLVFWLLLVFLPRQRLPAFLAVWAFACGVNILASWLTPALFVRWMILHPFNLEFIVGAAIAMVRTRNHGWISMLLACVWFALTAGYFSVTHYSAAMPIHIRIALFLPPSALLLYGILSVEAHGFKVPAALVKLGDWSYALYLTHILFIHLIYRTVRSKLLIEWTPAYCALLFVALVAGSIAIGYLYHRAVDRPLSLKIRGWMSRLLMRRKLVDS